MALANPVFRVELSSEGAISEASFNDAPVVATPRLMAVETAMAATPWLATGMNEFRLSVTGEAGEALSSAADVKATLVVRELGDEASQRPLASLAFRAADGSTEASSPPGEGMPGIVAGPLSVRRIANGVELVRPVRLGIQIPRWKWLDSDVIPDDAAVRTSLMVEYRRIWEQLDQRDVGFLPPLLSERTDEYRTALRADARAIPGDYGLGAMVRSGTLYPLDGPDDAIFRRFGGGRLVEYRRWDGNPLLCFVDDGLGRYFRLVFRRQGGRWIVTR